MRFKGRRLFGALIVAACFAAASTASAATIRTNATGYAGDANRTLIFDYWGWGMTCGLTLEFSASSQTFTAATLPATSLNHGRVTTDSAACTSGFTATPLNVPWTYDLVASGGAGNVTATTRIVIKNLQMQWGIPGTAYLCLYAGDVPTTIDATGAVMSASTSLPLVRGAITCPDPLSIRGTIALSPALAVTLS